MVNVGLRGYLFEQKPYEQRVQREVFSYTCNMLARAAAHLVCPKGHRPNSPRLPACAVQQWNLNGSTYEGYRAYVRYVKEFGFPQDNSTADISRLPTTESLQTEVRSGSRLRVQALPNTHCGKAAPSPTFLLFCNAI